jgi:hypothetical protein
MDADPGETTSPDRDGTPGGWFAASGTQHKPVFRKAALVAAVVAATGVGLGVTFAVRGAAGGSVSATARIPTPPPRTEQSRQATTTSASSCSLPAKA